MKVYIAGSSREIARVEQCALALERDGIEITLKWWDEIKKVGEANPMKAQWQDRNRWANNDVTAATESDLFWLLYPVTPSVGCFVELGYVVSRNDAGLRQHTDIVVSGNTKQSVFCTFGAEYETDMAALNYIIDLHNGRNDVG